MKERLKELRLQLGLSQNKFGEMIGLGQSGIGHIETGKRVLTDRNVDAVCRVFSVNKEWLLTGTGEIFVSDNCELDALVKKYNLSEEDRQMLSVYLKMNPFERIALQQIISKFGEALKEVK